MKHVAAAIAATILLAGCAWPWSQDDGGRDLEAPLVESQEFPPEPGGACLDLHVITEVNGAHNMTDHDGEVVLVARHAWPPEHAAGIYGAQTLLDSLRINAGVLHRHLLHEAHWHILQDNRGHADEGLGHKEPHTQSMTLMEVNRVESEVVAKWPNLCIAIEATP